MVGGLRSLLDLSIDWRQALTGLARFVRDHDIGEIKLSFFGVEECVYRSLRCQILGCTPETGMLAISVNHLYALTLQYAKYSAWLRGHDPLARVGGSIYVYQIERLRRT
jgi:hypothetical protein